MNDVTESTKDTLGWLLNTLVDNVPGARCAVVLAGDGLLMEHSRALRRDTAETLAAVASSLQGAAKGPGLMLDGGPVRQTMVEYVDGCLFVMAAGENASLAVYTAADVDLGLIAYEMTTMVKRVGAHVKAATRRTATAQAHGLRA
ncbi:MAG: roadblock/LC7 domain-containing protein [Actinocatenispora sp.]